MLPLGGQIKGHIALIWPFFIWACKTTIFTKFIFDRYLRLLGLTLICIKIHLYVVEVGVVTIYNSFNGHFKLFTSRTLVIRGPIS